MYGNRTNFQCIGVGKRRTGTSQYGAYDFIPVSFAFKDSDYHGLRVAEFAFSPNEIPQDMAPGKEYDVVYHFQKGKLRIDAILG